MGKAYTWSACPVYLFIQHCILNTPKPTTWCMMGRIFTGCFSCWPGFVCIANPLLPESLQRTGVFTGYCSAELYNYYLHTLEWYRAMEFHWKLENRFSYLSLYWSLGHHCLAWCLPLWGTGSNTWIAGQRSWITLILLYIHFIFCTRQWLCCWHILGEDFNSVLMKYLFTSVLSFFLTIIFSSFIHFCHYKVFVWMKKGARNKE